MSQGSRIIKCDIRLGRLDFDGLHLCCHGYQPNPLSLISFSWTSYPTVKCCLKSITLFFFLPRLGKMRFIYLCAGECEFCPRATPAIDSAAPNDPGEILPAKNSHSVPRKKNSLPELKMHDLENVLVISLSGIIPPTLPRPGRVGYDDKKKTSLGKSRKKKSKACRFYFKILYSNKFMSFFFLPLLLPSFQGSGQEKEL